MPYCPSFGWTVRALTLADFLSRQGAEVTVLASRSQEFGYFGHEQLAQNVRVEYLDDPRLTRYYQECVNGTVPQKVPWWNQYLVPDRGLIRAPLFFRAASRLIQREKMDVVVTTSPPHSTHLFGLLLKLRFGRAITWVTDFRDGWTNRADYQATTFLARKVSRIMERSVLRRCDLLSHVAPSMLENWKRLLTFDISDKSVLVRNGILSKKGPFSRDISERKGPLRIGFFGSLSTDDRNLTLAALERALYSEPALLEELEFHFFLPTSQPFLSPWAQLHPPLPHPQALERMADMDYLLLVVPETPGYEEVMTGKIFDYLSVRRPILCLAPARAASAQLVSMEGVGLALESDSELGAGLWSLRDRWKELAYACERIELDRFRREHQYEGLLKALQLKTASSLEPRA